MSEDGTIEVDGLGRTHGERLVDQTKAAVEGERLIAFAELCEALATDVSAVRSPWGRWLARHGLHTAAEVARDTARQLSRDGLSLETVRDFVLTHGRAR